MPGLPLPLEPSPPRAVLRLRRAGPLWAQAARGDAAAFAAVYERHHEALYRYCRSILLHDEDARDALQNTMVSAFAALRRERRDFELRPWLFRIAHNEAISILRRRGETHELVDPPGHASELDDRVAEREELRLLRLDLDDLPERQRAALVLRELNGLGHAEIGAVLELSPTAVRHAIFEARNALFSCREGRAQACEDVRRLISDGDGRTLRGRGLRAHLRSCGGCLSYRDELQRRRRALRALAPPLPVATAAALLAQVLGSGTAAKLLACVAIAGGGVTLAGELQGGSEAARDPGERAELVRPEPAPRIPVPDFAAEARVAPRIAAARAPSSIDESRRQRRPTRAKARRRSTPASIVETQAPVTLPHETRAPVLPVVALAPQRRARPESRRRPEPPATRERTEMPATIERPVTAERPAAAEVERPAAPERPAPTTPEPPVREPEPTATPSRDTGATEAPPPAPTRTPTTRRP